MVKHITVEERHPLKQGLKLKFFIINNFTFSVEERHPLKQGLKPSYPSLGRK